MSEKIEDVENELNLLKDRKIYLKSEVNRLENEIMLENLDNIEYLYELDKKSPRASIQ
jgi:hypothetical protein